MKELFIITCVMLLTASATFSQPRNSLIDKNYPSISYYFDWINSEWPGSHEQKVLANLEFFKWMKKTYDMQLDLYLMDAGNLDRSPGWVEEADTREEGLRYAYGDVNDKRFRSKYPNGIDPMFELASSMGTKMGIWLGPDGFGETLQDAIERQNMIVDFTRKYRFGIFKFDRACTDLRPDKEKYFIEMLKKCRSYVPDLITIGHRISFSPKAESFMTTGLWGDPKETYVDVHTWNTIPAIHHRVGNLARGLPAGLNRMVEDHGVCFSSCLDYWEDDIVMQAFARNLILSPEIYGSPFFLSDEEFPKLARLFNLHRQYRYIMVDGIKLPEAEYGDLAVSRGDENTRIVTIANLGWDTQNRSLSLNSEIGLEPGEKFVVKQLHPVERVIGEFGYNDNAEVEVQPFRMGMYLISNEQPDDIYIEGVDYEVIKNIPGQPAEINLLGMPGESASIRVLGAERFTKANIDGESQADLVNGKRMTIYFDGTPYKNKLHYKLAAFEEAGVPRDAETLYEATCFAADNNALEVRTMKRSGPSKHNVVRTARNEFFTDSTFWKKGIWDKYAWDNDPDTWFKVREYGNAAVAVEPGTFRFDLGKIAREVSITLKGLETGYEPGAIEYATEPGEWKKAKAELSGGRLSIEKIPQCRYIRIENTPLQIQEITVQSDYTTFEPENWRASNLFKKYDRKSFRSAQKAGFQLDEIPENSYLVVSVPGEYGNEQAFAALKVDGEYIGSPDRAPSYECNHWEHVVRDVDGNYAYYFPLKKEYTGKKMEAWILGLNNEVKNSDADVWLTTYPVPYQKKKLVLE